MSPPHVKDICRLGVYKVIMDNILKFNLKKKKYVFLINLRKERKMFLY